MHDRRVADALKKMKRVLGPQALAHLGASSGLVQRSRCVTAQRLVPSLLASLGSRRLASLAELHRDFNSDHGSVVCYKPFYERLDSPAFPAMTRALFYDMMRELTQQVLRPEADSPLRHFEDVLLQDGSSFALHDALAAELPGRFSANSPAAIKLHCTMSLLHDNISALTLSPDTACERAFLPAPESLRNKLLLADRGYDGTDYMAEVDAAGGSYLIRVRKNLNPCVVSVQGRGKALRRLEGLTLGEALRRAPRAEALDFDACWPDKNDGSRPCRVVVLYNPVTRAWMRLMTNVPRDVLSAADILAAYRLRWQIELLFKELKSHANLHRFVTRKKTIAEGLVWATLAAALFKRFIAHGAQLGLRGIAISTRRAAMCGRHIFDLLFCRHARRPVSAASTLARIHAYLGRHARRDNPARERASGRLLLGLAACGSEA